MKRYYTEAERLAENLDMSQQEEGGLIRENHYPSDGPGRPMSGQCYYYIRPDTSTLFHRLDCDEYWVYHAGRDVEVWIIDPEGRLEKRRLGVSEGAELCLFFPRGVAFAARYTDSDSTGTLISAITVPRFSNDGLQLLDREEIVRLCADAKYFFIKE